MKIISLYRHRFALTVLSCVSLWIGLTLTQAQQVIATPIPSQAVMTQAACMTPSMTITGITFDMERVTVQFNNAGASVYLTGLTLDWEQSSSDLFAVSGDSMEWSPSDVGELDLPLTADDTSPSWETKAVIRPGSGALEFVFVSKAPENVSGSLRFSCTPNRNESVIVAFGRPRDAE